MVGSVNPAGGAGAWSGERGAGSGERGAGSGERGEGEMGGNPRRQCEVERGAPGSLFFLRPMAAGCKSAFPAGEREVPGGRRLAVSLPPSAQAPRISEISARDTIAFNNSSRGTFLSWSIVTVRSKVNLPERVRRSALRCPPQPRPAPMSWA